jgi:hypothetical protein
MSGATKNIHNLFVSLLHFCFCSLVLLTSLPTVEQAFLVVKSRGRIALSEREGQATLARSRRTTRRSRRVTGQGQRMPGGCEALASSDSPRARTRARDDRRTLSLERALSAGAVHTDPGRENLSRARPRQRATWYSLIFLDSSSRSSSCPGRTATPIGATDTCAANEWLTWTRGGGCRSVIEVFAYDEAPSGLCSGKDAPLLRIDMQPSPVPRRRPGPRADDPRARSREVAATARSAVCPTAPAARAGRP